MTRADRRQRRRREVRLQLGVVALAVLVGAVAGLTGSPRDEARGADSATATRTPTDRAPRVPPERTLLLGHETADHHLDLLVVVGVRDRGREGTVLLVPTHTLVEVPSLGTQTIADRPSLGDRTLVTTSLANVLGLRFDSVLLADDSQLADLLGAAGPFDVTSNRTVRVQDPAGTVGLVAGRQRVDPATADRLLLAPGDAGELEHLVTVQSVLDGWRASLADRHRAAATTTIAPQAEALVALAHGDVRYETLPVDLVATGGDEQFGPRRADIRALIARRFPADELGGGGPRPRVELLNGTGGVGVTVGVAARIVPAGGEVTLTDNVPGFGVATTQVVYYRDDGLAAARRIARALGVRRIAKADQPIDVVDVTVIIGADLSEPTTS